MYKLMGYIWKIMTAPVRVCYRCISDTPIIGYMALILMLSQNVYGREVRCITPINSKEMICNHTMNWKSMQMCCYNYEKDYFYCCPMLEARRSEYSTRFGGILIVSILTIFTIFFLCIFCTRCPIGRAIHKRRIHDRQDHVTDVVNANG